MVIKAPIICAAPIDIFLFFFLMWFRDFDVIVLPRFETGRQSRGANIQKQRTKI